ncbi:MAG: hypothetical protein ACJ763_11535 [Bdellovibrionia bacterium]
MLISRLWIFLVLLSWVPQGASAMTMPMNHLEIQDNPRALYNISPVMFRQIIDQVVTAFSPIVRFHGGELKANYFWDNRLVNASATREGNVWMLNMYGGLARRREITPDAFSLVVCHELGHHLGGFPFVSAGLWAADEGQADYFAAHTCAPVIWGRDFQGNAIHRYTVDPVAKLYCDRSTLHQTERDLCYRIADAAQSLSNLLNTIEDARRPVAYKNANNAIHTWATYHGHPKAQCRLETFLNGAICGRKSDLRVIPAYDMNIVGGSLLEEEKEAARYSCAERGAVYDGARPRCWFQQILVNWD